MVTPSATEVTEGSMFTVCLSINSTHVLERDVPVMLMLDSEGKDKNCS